jgi:hypothetical protein
MDFAPVTSGRLQARVEGSRLLLEPPHGGSAAAAELEPSVLLQAAGGSWRVEDVEAVPRRRKAHLSVRDETGSEAATAWLEGKRQRIEVASETLILENPSLLPFRWSYRIEGLFVARPALASFGRRNPRHMVRPFTVEILPKLAQRPDASLLLALAAYLTYQDFASNQPM